MNREGSCLFVENHQQDVKGRGTIVSEEESAEVEVTEMRWGPDDYVLTRMGPEPIGEITGMDGEPGFDDVRVIRTTKIKTARRTGLKCDCCSATSDTSRRCPLSSSDLYVTRELLSTYWFALHKPFRGNNRLFYRDSAEKRLSQIKPLQAAIALDRSLSLVGHSQSLRVSGRHMSTVQDVLIRGEVPVSQRHKAIPAKACSVDVFQTPKEAGPGNRGRPAALRTHAILIL